MWPNPQFSAELVTFTGEILNGKFKVLYSVYFNANKKLAEFSYFPFMSFLKSFFINHRYNIIYE